MPLVVELGGHYVASLGLALAALETSQPTRFFAPSGAVSLGPRTIPSSDAAVRPAHRRRRAPRHARPQPPLRRRAPRRDGVRELRGGRARRPVRRDAPA